MSIDLTTVGPRNRGEVALSPDDSWNPGDYYVANRLPFERPLGFIRKLTEHSGLIQGRAFAPLSW